MNAFNKHAEPILFVQQLYAHAHSVDRSVALTQLLAGALLAEDYERVQIVHEQISRITEEVIRIELSLYARIKNMHFHPAGGYAFSQYLTCQGKVAGSAQELADLLVLRQTTIPAALRDDFLALVTQVVNVSRRALSLMEGLSSEAQTLCADTEAESPLNAMRGVPDDRGQAGRLRRKFAQRVYSLEEQLDPVTIILLDKCCTLLHKVADSAEHAIDHLGLMVQ